MNPLDAALERALALFGELIGEDAELGKEYAASLEAFPAEGGTPDADAAGIRRRHLEWFVLERPCTRLDGPPVQGLADEWHARAGNLEKDCFEALVASLAGAFEVTGVDAGKGVWLRDLFGLGEYPIHEPEASSELSSGDLVVGRVFPTGDGLFRLSPAAGCFRNHTLLDALTGDLERLRATRRGSLRIQQNELERLFFGGTDGRLQEDAADVRERTLDALEELGLTAEGASIMLDEIDAEAAEPETDGQAVTRALNHLAFETTLDLDGLRRVLGDYWGTLRTELRGADEEASVDRDPAATPDPESSAEADPREALARFDQGRAQGRDLETLFRDLEADLGLDSTTADDDAPAPDFPGVVGAMVEEFLWDLERAEGAEVALRCQVLRSLSEYGEDIGVFEELGARQLLDFAGRWILDEGQLADPSEAVVLFDALGRFCRWCEEQHAHPLWKEFGAQLEGLVEAVPRLIPARGALVLFDRSEADLYEVIDRGGGVLGLSHPRGDDCPAEIPEPLVPHLREGDLVIARATGPEAEPCACYPAAVRELLTV